MLCRVVLLRDARAAHGSEVRSEATEATVGEILLIGSLRHAAVVSDLPAGDSVSNRTTSGAASTLSTISGAPGGWLVASPAASSEARRVARRDRLVDRGVEAADDGVVGVGRTPRPRRRLR